MLSQIMPVDKPQHANIPGVIMNIYWMFGFYKILNVRTWENHKIGLGIIIFSDMGESTF